jgi:S-adenosylmethionine/arginine decarboxylase-like enzyme
MKQWTEVPDEFLIIRGLSKSSLFTEEKIREYLDSLADLLGMKKIGSPKFEWCSDVPLDETVSCHGVCAVGFWKTSGVTIYTWNEVQKISVCIHSCKDIDVAKAGKYTIRFWDMSQYQVLNHENRWSPTILTEM